MARRTGRSTGPAKRGGSSPDYGLASSKQYQQQTKERLRNRAMRTWTIRLVVLVVLGLAGWMWGGDLVAMVTQKGREAKYELRKSEQGVQDANDRRSGADFNPEE